MPMCFELVKLTCSYGNEYECVDYELLLNDSMKVISFEYWTCAVVRKHNCLEKQPLRLLL